jgi:hypothetical protein
MKKVTIEFIQAAVVACVLALPFVFYFASMKP